MRMSWVVGLLCGGLLPVVVLVVFVLVVVVVVVVVLVVVVLALGCLRKIWRWMGGGGGSGSGLVPIGLFGVGLGGFWFGDNPYDLFFPFFYGKFTTLEIFPAS